MTATADMILERRRTRRRLAFWRIAAIVAFVIALLVVVPWGGLAGSAERAHIARIAVDGAIVDDRERTEAIRKIADRDSAKALIVDIASPGGTVVGSEALYEALRSVAAKKPVVAVVGEVAASGGYITALAADHIVTRRNSITGSIGVLSMVPNVATLLERIGVSVREIKSSPLKAAPSTFNEPDPRAIAAMENLIEDSYGWFRGIVGERRGLSGAALDRVADGRVFTGHQAKELGLVDTIGARPEARDWLSSEHGIGPDLDVRTHTWGESDLPFPLDLIDSGASSLLPPGIGNLTSGPRLMALYTQ